MKIHLTFCRFHKKYGSINIMLISLQSLRFHYIINNYKQIFRNLLKKNWNSLTFIGFRPNPMDFMNIVRIQFTSLGFLKPKSKRFN